MYRQLSADHIERTVQTLERRIGERFPDSGLLGVASELSQVAEETRARAEFIGRPHLWVRATVVLLLAAIAVLLALVPTQLRTGEVETLLDFVQVLDPSLSSSFFLGALVVFLWTIEMRLKRARALRAIHELRSLAHVVDMHQLTKDPHGRHDGHTTPASPQRVLSDYELYRYFNYCSELLSMISKVAALYVQDFHDSEALTAVDEVETLCTGLSRKIWQKIVLLQQEAPPAAAVAAAGTPD